MLCFFIKVLNEAAASNASVVLMLDDLDAVVTQEIGTYSAIVVAILKRLQIHNNIFFICTATSPAVVQHVLRRSGKAFIVFLFMPKIRRFLQFHWLFIKPSLF